MKKTLMDIYDFLEDLLCVLLFLVGAVLMLLASLCFDLADGLSRLARLLYGVIHDAGVLREKRLNACRGKGSSSSEDLLAEAKR